MGFYKEMISGPKNDSSKRPVWRRVVFSLPVFVRYTIFFNVVEKKSTLQCF